MYNYLDFFIEFKGCFKNKVWERTDKNVLSFRITAVSLFALDELSYGFWLMCNY